MNRPRPMPRRITTLVVLAVLLPVALVTVVLTTYYAWARYSDLTSSELALGEITVNYLAQEAELALYAGDKQALQELATEVLQRPATQSIAFLDSLGDVIVQQGQPSQEPGKKPPPALFDTREEGSRILFSQPVSSRPMDVDDFGSVAKDSPQKIIGWVELGLSRAAATSRINAMLLGAGLFALAAFALGAIVARRAEATISRPVLDLTKHLRQLDEPQPQYEFQPRGSQEMVFLAQRVNELVDRIRRQLDQQSDEIESATTTLSRRNRQLEETRLGLEQALQAKDDFLARVSHELRTPLTTIIGFNRLVSTGQNPEQVAEYSEHIAHGAALLHSIIDDILDYSRLQSAWFELEHIPFNLEECLENIVGMHGYEAMAKQLELVFLLDSDVPRHCIGDPQRLQQVVNNLVANAMKFTPQGEVIIRVTLVEHRQEQATLQCEIRDTGVGIPNSEQERLFQAFTQADNSITRKYGGSGLGLAISRSLVEKMDGKIELSSEQGQGTTVTFSFSVGLDPQASELGAQVGHANIPVLAYDSNDWSRRALRTTLLQWSTSISVCAERESFMTQLAAAENTTLVVLSLSHSEAQTEPFVRFARDIRQLFQGPVLVLSSVPDMAEQAQSNGLTTDRLGFALKPLRRRRLIKRANQLIYPDSPERRKMSASPSLAGLHILVAEDHPLIRDLLARNLRSAGATVEPVADGEQAVLASLGSNFDLLLLDLHMPRMDGAEATQSIRSQGGTMPILCLTADITAQERQALGDSGVDAILLKPINDVELVRLVRQHCGLEKGVAVGKPLISEDSSTTSLQDSLLNLLAASEQAYLEGDDKRYQASLHSLLGLTGMYEKRLLEEMIREMKHQGFALETAEAEHLFAEAKTLIHKY